MTSLPPLPREEYITDEGSAIIGRWRNDPLHPPHLVRLAHTYEDEDDPRSVLTLDEMLELATIFNETAALYVKQGSYHVAPFLRAEAAHLEQLSGELLDAQNEDESKDPQQEELAHFIDAVFRIEGVESAVMAYMPPQDELKHSHSSSTLISR